MDIKEIKDYKQECNALVWLTLPKLKSYGKFLPSHGTFQIRVHPEVLQALKIKQVNN